MIEVDYTAQLDPGIKDYVKLFWKHDIKTLSSCQGGGEHHHWPDRFILGHATDADLTKIFNICKDARLPVENFDIKPRFLNSVNVDSENYPWFFIVNFTPLVPGDEGFGWYDIDRGP